MPLFKNLFQSGKADEGITSLHLETPNGQLHEDNSNSAGRRLIDPKLLAIAGPEIKRRANKMLEAGRRPQDLYLAVDGANKGWFSFRTSNPDRNVLLIFTSGYAAMDYLKTARIAGGVHMFPFESLQVYAEYWRKARIDSFVLDRCPRCLDFFCAPIDVHTVEQFLTLWAHHRATRDFQSEKLVHAYFDSLKAGSPQREVRSFLETLRDHLDFGVPYVHWLIAIHAGIDGDQEAKIASIQNLEAFGSDFKGKVSRDETFVLEEWSKSVAEAHLGLLATFEMLRPDLQSAARIKKIID
jgi:hypothetical protein